VIQPPPIETERPRRCVFCTAAVPVGPPSARCAPEQPT